MSRLSNESIDILVNLYKDRCMENALSYNVDLALNDLKKYKDLEEKGLLLKLPCKVGDIIYDISTFDILSYKVESFKMLGNRVETMRTSYIVNDTLLFSKSYVSDIGKTVFLTKEEAEQELKRLESAE